MKIKFYRFAFTVLAALALAASLAPTIDHLVNRIISPDTILHGSPITALLALLALALVIGTTAKGLANTVWHIIDGRPRINLEP